MTKWPTVELGEVASTARRTLAPEQIRAGTKYVGLEDIAAGGKLLRSNEVAAGQIASAKFEFSPRHVLFGKLRPYLSKITVADFDGVCSTDIVPILPSELLDKRYLLQFLRQPAIVALAHSRSAGANLPRLSPRELEKFEIPLPPLPEQRRIAAILDHADALRTKRREALARLDELTQAIFFDMFGDPMRSSTSWDERRISDVCELVVDCVNRTAPVVDHATDFRMIRTTNVKAGIVNLDEVRYVTADTYARWNRRATPRRGDVLLTREAPVGEAGIIQSDENVFLGQRLMLYRVDKTQLTPDYLLAELRGPFVQSQLNQNAAGSTVKHLPLPACREFLVRTPPIEAQLEFSHRMQQIKVVRQKHRNAADRYAILFASLQSRAFRGEL